MKLSEKQLNQIKNILNLESISQIEKLTIVCFPKKEDDEFKKRFIDIKKQLKNISPVINIVIGSDGVLDGIKLIEYKGE